MIRSASCECMDRLRDRTETSAWIGRPLLRLEDDALLRGQGRFIDDIDLPGCLHLQFLRSPSAHGRIRKLDVAEAERSPGVASVITARDAGHLGQPAVNLLLPDVMLPKWAVLPADIVEWVGQPVAAVIATSLHAASDAVQRIRLDLDEVPENRETKISLFQHRWKTSSVAEAFARAHHTARISVKHARLAPAPLEPRLAMAVYDDDGGLTLWLPTQSPHRARADLSRVFALPEERIKVLAPDVGGAFGGKASIYPEDIIVALAAMKLRRPVKWVGTRTEEFLAATHGRGAVCEGELAVDAAGRFLALRANFEFPLGARLPYSALVPARNAGRILPGPYDIREIDVTVCGRPQNRAAMGIYRGAGRPEAAMLMECLVEEAARIGRVDPFELRHKNLLCSEQLPSRAPTGEVIDSGDFPALLLKAERAARTKPGDGSLAKNRLVGIGCAVYIEPCGQGWESATIELAEDGRIRAATGASAQGQGRVTAYAQIVADVLGLPLDRIEVVHGDTSLCPTGIGSLASRSTAIGGSALFQAAENFRETARRCAACLMGCTIDQVIATPDGFESLGSGKRLDWHVLSEAARSKMLPPAFTPGLLTHCVYHADGEAWSSGCCVALVEIDPETGELRVIRIVWVDDAGTVVNPILVRGQLLGGLAQGLGAALMERLVYDEHGQLLTASFMDYAMPRAADMPQVDFGELETPSPMNLLGAKGVGEAGCIGIPAAIVNAAMNGLAPLGVGRIDMPLTSYRIWQAIQDARQASRGEGT